jgi:DME family drug/metabolite transporter
VDTNTTNKARQITGPLFIVLAAVLWGTTGTAQAFAPAGATPASVGAVRLGIGGLGLLALAWAQGVLPQRKTWYQGDTLLAALSVAAYQPLFFSGVSRTGVALGTIVGIGSAPVMAGVAGFLLRGERPKGRWGVATLLAVAGCTLLLASGSTIDIDPGGVGLALGAGAAYALYTTYSKNLLERHPPDAVMAMIFSLGALGLLPLLFLGDLGWLGQLQGLAIALHLGLLATTLSYILFARGLRMVPVASAVTLSLAEPLTAGALGLVLLRERLALPAWLGIGLLLAGLALLAGSPGESNTGE